MLMMRSPDGPVFDGGTPAPADLDLRRAIAELFTDEDTHRARTVKPSPISALSVGPDSLVRWRRSR